MAEISAGWPRRFLAAFLLVDFVKWSPHGLIYICKLVDLLLVVFSASGLPLVYLNYPLVDLLRWFPLWLISLGGLFVYSSLLNTFPQYRCNPSVGAYTVSRRPFFIDLHIGFYSGSSILAVTSYVLFDLWLPQTAPYWMISSDCLAIGYNDCHNGTATKPPMRKHPSYKTSPIKMSQGKTSQLQNFPIIKLPSYKTFQASKCLSYKTS